MGDIATEQQSVEQNLAQLPHKRRWASSVFSRLRGVAALPEPARVLDVGAAGGGFVVAARQLGFECEGVEPWEQARHNAVELGQRVGITLQLAAGTAESIPFADSTFDIVHASSVMEHVADADRAFAEAFRVLKVGGILWFNTASAMCPMQDEISGFPLFGWYPSSVKVKIMDWVKDAKPHLVGHSRTPAIHWFTPWKARAMLRKQGFSRVYDRWDLRGQDEDPAAYRLALRAIRSNAALKVLADVVVAGCSYAAVK